MRYGESERWGIWGGKTPRQRRKEQAAMDERDDGPVEVTVTVNGQDNLLDYFLSLPPDVMASLLSAS